MLAPRTGANPAKLVLTLPASHMIATTILVDRRIAMWALFCIGMDPIRRLAIVLTFFKPETHNRTNHRLVRRQTTSETKTVTTVATNRGNNRV